MKYLFTTVFVISLSFGYRPHEKQDQIPMEFIFTGTVVEAITDSAYDMKMQTVFKGQADYPEITIVYGSTVLEPGVAYLVYGLFDFKKGYLTAEKVVALGEAGEEIARLFRTIPCIVEPRVTGACHRTGSSVCGCDKKTYGSPCEATRKVRIYSFGRCEE